MESAPGRVRPIAAAFCAGLCVLSITGGMLLGYAARVLFRPEAFADRVAASLAEPGVATLVATRLTDGLIAQRRDLTAFRPIILATSETLIASAPFRAVVRRAARIAHQTMISQAGEDITLSIADANVILQSALSATPDLAKKIPDRATALLATSGEAPGGRIIVRLVRFARDLRISALTLLIFGLLAGTASFFLATQRRRFLMRLGIALAVTAVILRLAVGFGGDALAVMAKDELIGKALAGVWHAFLSGFTSWLLVLGGAGLVLAAGAASLFERVELLRIRDAMWTWLTEFHERKIIRLLRAFVLLALGSLAILAPAFVIEASTLLIGGVVFFIGLREFFALALHAIPQPEHRQAAAGAGPVSGGRIVAVSVVSLALLAAIGYYFFSAASTTISNQPAETCNGSSELCDRPLNQIVFPTTHNSMSAADIPDWMFPEQETSIPVQLQDGVRGFLFDAHYGMRAGDRVKTLLEDEAAARKKYEAVLGKEGVDAAMRIRDRLVGAEEGTRSVYLCHGFCELGATPLVPVLRKVREFLVMNPNEVLVFVIQDEGVTPQDIEKCFRESGLIDFVYRGPMGPPWPTLRKMVAGNERVMVFAENNSAGVPWYHQAYESMQETPYTFHKPEDFSCRPNRGKQSNSLFLINHWIETAPAPRPSNAEIVNAYDFLLERARSCERERGMLPNLLAVDFYRTGDLFKVVQTLNGLESAHE